jgi:Tol biopolymer transport system component
LTSHEFRPFPSNQPGLLLDFLRDGKWIMYVNYLDNTLWRSRLDGSEQLQLTSPPMNSLLPRWSPDGRQIAFGAQQPGKPWQVCIVSADGGAIQTPVPGKGQQNEPSWSPDGNSLLFGGGYIPSRQKRHG